MRKARRIDIQQINTSMVLSALARILGKQLGDKALK